MRYQSWDIILFPGGCHVPIQEFRTACFAVQQNGKSRFELLVKASRVLVQHC